MAKPKKGKKKRSAKQKANDRRLGRMAKARAKCATKAKGGKKKGGKKGGRKRRTPAQKANDRRLGQMARARAKGGKKGSKKGGKKGGRKSGKKGSKRAHSGGGGKGMTASEKKRLAHVEKVQNQDHKTIIKHSRQIATLAATEKAMAKVLVEAKNSKVFHAPKVKGGHAMRLPKTDWAKVAAATKQSVDASEAAQANKYS